MGLSVSNLIVSIGVAFDAQLKAADNLFFASAVDFSDATRPQFGGSLGTIDGASTTLANADGAGFVSVENPVAGDPVTVRTISTADGPRYQIVDGNGQEITVEAKGTAGATWDNVPRYLVKADGIVYDVLDQPGGAGNWTDPTGNNPNIVTENHYDRPIGRITFKAKEGATIARAQDDLQRTGSIVQLLTRLLESIQDEAKGFSSLVR